jgi:hypothetical protein
MLQSRRTRVAATLIAALTALVLAPATASALQVSITDDAGNPVPLAPGMALRHMSPTVGIGFDPNEKVRYSASFAGPDNVAVSTPIGCYGIQTNRRLDYRGNGPYTVTIQRYGEKDYDCKTPVGQPLVYQFTINGSVALAGPPRPRVGIRRPNSLVTQPIVLGFAGNPGQGGAEVRYALNGVIGPDGGIAGPSNEAFVDPTTGQVPLRLRTPGRYVVVARAKGIATSTGQFFTPWTPPVTINAVAPFDIESVRTLDSRGPSYRIRVQLREKTARGRVSIAVRRGKRGKYRSLGSVKIKAKGRFTKRFTLRRTGTYTMRFRFKGSATTAAGTVHGRFRVSRRIVF